MPDSMDIVSMWSGAPNRYEITPEQKADKEFVQKVKGTKLMEVSLISQSVKAGLLIISTTISTSKG